MRELDSTKFILDRIIQQVHATNGTRVTKVHLALGEVSELDQNVIQKHWNELSKSTVAENAGLDFRIVIAEVQCMSCFKKYHPENGVIHCANCGSFGAKILSGEEFHVESIEMDFE
jgi:hydrogenase nickel incorporation protein HypA/HybF